MILPQSDKHKERTCLHIYCILAEIPGVARDSIRNEGTREINYGSCISALRPDRIAPGKRATGTHWIGGWSDNNGVYPTSELLFTLILSLSSSFLRACS
jgi:hypothetical protein